MPAADTALSRSSLLELNAPAAGRCAPDGQVSLSGEALENAASPDISVLYEQNVARIYRYHLARTGNADVAQDLTAETFHAALESIHRYRPSSGPPAAWLAGIARHKLLDYFRRYRPQVSLDVLENRPGTAAAVEDQANHNLDMARVTRAMARMTAERSEALALHYFAGLSLAETGQAMGKSLAAATKLVQRGLEDLKRYLVEPSQEETIAAQRRQPPGSPRGEKEVRE
jgi:RNA polymerase sigma-70 factor (ECF subfamily)